MSLPFPRSMDMSLACLLTFGMLSGWGKYLAIDPCVNDISLVPCGFPCDGTSTAQFAWSIRHPFSCFLSDLRDWGFCTAFLFCFIWFFFLASTWARQAQCSNQQRFLFLTAQRLLPKVACLAGLLLGSSSTMTRWYFTHRYRQCSCISLHHMQVWLSEVLRRLACDNESIITSPCMIAWLCVPVFFTFLCFYYFMLT